MHRFYADENGIQDGIVRLTAEDALHASKVLRLSCGEHAEVFANHQRYSAEVITVSTGETTLRILSPLPSTEPKLNITLFQGLPKGDKMEWIVQKAVELGVSRIVPLAMERSVVQLSPKDAMKKQIRWQRIAHEACKQSCRCVEPSISQPMTIMQVSEALKELDATVVPWEEEFTYNLRSFNQTFPTLTSIGIIIGPEGGISQHEIDLFCEYGCLPITLGPRILRTETAGICTISALMCLYGEMELTEVST